MVKAKNLIPPGHHTVTPQLTMDNAANAIDWYKNALAPKKWHARRDRTAKSCTRKFVSAIRSSC